MIKYCREIIDVFVFGIDGEENLYNVMVEVFVNVKYFCCDIYLKDNVKRKLNDLGIGGIVVLEIFFDIFGKGMGNVVEGGFVDCKLIEEFDVVFEDVMKNWKSLYENGVKFCGYFLKEKVDVICNCCIVDICLMCGLGFLLKVYIQNVSECMNCFVKVEDDLKYGKKVIGFLFVIECIRIEIRWQYEE